MPRWSESFYLATVSQVAETISALSLSLNLAQLHNNTCQWRMSFHVDGVQQCVGYYTVPASVVRVAYRLAQLRASL